MTYEVTYTSKMKKTSSIIVRARNASEALKNATHLCHTGADFRNPLVINENFYVKPRKQGFAGKN